MKRIISFDARIAILITMLIGNITCYAENFISDICVFTTYIPKLDIENLIKVEEYNAQQKLGSEWKLLRADFNSTVYNLESSEYSTYIMYKTTTNPKEAITGILLQYCKPGDQTHTAYQNPTFTYEGKTYHSPVYYLGNTFEVESEYRQWMYGSVNSCRGDNGTIPHLYLYYTKDGAATEKGGVNKNAKLLTSLYATDKQSDKNVGRFDPYSSSFSNNANTNEGRSNSPITYIGTSWHTHESWPDPDDDSGLYACQCDFEVYLDDLTEPVLKDNVYQISTLSELCWWRDFVNASPDNKSSNAALTKDIDMSGIKKLRNGSWEPIGTSWETDDDNWSGTFDGAGHSLSNLYINGNEISSHGLFGIADGTIKDLTIANAQVTSGLNAAAIVGISNKKIIIDGCTVSGSINAKFVDSGSGTNVLAVSAAGIANISNKCEAIITNCTNNATITSAYYASGVLGTQVMPNMPQNYTINMDRCINNGEVKGKYLTSAFATFAKGRIINCLNTARITITENNSNGYLIGQYDFYGNTIFRNNLNITNTSTDTPFGNITDNYSLGRDLNGKTIDAEVLRSGELCYQLNSGNTDKKDIAWFQTLGTDEYPKPAKIGEAVFHFSNCSGSRYTNYKLYAEDMDNSGHHFTYTEGSVSGDKLSMSITYTCVNCGQEFNGQAIKKETRCLTAPSCESWGYNLITYEFKAEDITPRLFYRLETIAAINRPHHCSQTEATSYGFHVCSTCNVADEKSFEVPLKDSNGNYLIRNIGNLISFRNLHNNRDINDDTEWNAILMADLDFSACTSLNKYLWEAIGSNNTCWTGGTFDGNGHTIKGIYTHQALFDNIANCTIKNLTVEGISQGFGYECALLCRNAVNSRFENITVRGSVIGKDKVAGFCINATNCVFHQCNNYANIQSSANFIGGIVAYANGGEFSKCTNFGKIEGCRSEYVGGLVGDYIGTFNISNCGNYGEVCGYKQVAGICGGNRIENNLTAPNHAYSNLNVGQISLLGENNNKGAFSGYCDLPTGFRILLRDFYYKGAQTPVGNYESQLSESIYEECDDEQLASGEICYKLNKNQTDSEIVWHQEIGVDATPYPFGTSVIYAVQANNETFFVTPECTISSLELHPVDGKEYYFHTDVPFYVENMKYVREATVKKNFYATLYLPFGFHDDRLKIMDFDHYDATTGKVYFEEIKDGETIPNHPYLIRVADDCPYDEVTISIAASNAHVIPEPEGYAIDFSDEDVAPYVETGFYGTYGNHVIYGLDGYFAFSGKYGDFRKANTATGTKFNPFRAVFKVGEDNSGVAPAKLILAYTDKTEDDTETTGIDASNVIEIDNVPIYNLNGQQVGTSATHLKSGIYIQNGKKILIK